jgi:segregation and condensation protein B
MANPPAKPLPDQPADERPSKSAAVVEALLFTSDSPLPAARIAELAELPGERAVKDAVAALNARYERDGAAFCIQALAGGYQMLTRPEFHDCIARLLRDRSDSRLTQAAMETLAIVAYRQPILRADVEAIRGVACGEVLRGLLERQLIKIVGRAQVIGRPMLYGTTRRFLEVFGLENLDDLPKVEELRTAAARSPAASPASPEPVEGPATASAAPADAAPSQPPTVPSEPQEK